VPALLRRILGRLLLAGLAGPRGRGLEHAHDSLDRDPEPDDTSERDVLTPVGRQLVRLAFVPGIDDRETGRSREESEEDERGGARVEGFVANNDQKAVGTCADEP